jgi:hypothetical protein
VLRSSLRFVAEAEYDRARLVALVTEIGRFHITDRRMRRAQTAMRDELARERPLATREVRAYVKAVTRYFAGFEREARVHLADLDLRLGRVSQLQYNLSAERGVAERRVEATQGVLSRVQELAPQ